MAKLMKGAGRKILWGIWWKVLYSLINLKTLGLDVWGLFTSLLSLSRIIFGIFAKALAYRPSVRPCRKHVDVIITRLVCICEVTFREPRGGKCALHSVFPLMCLTPYTDWPCSGLFVLCLFASLWLQTVVLLRTKASAFLLLFLLNRTLFNLIFFLQMPDSWPIWCRMSAGKRERLAQGLGWGFWIVNYFKYTLTLLDTNA